jgi:hypothetical protein
VDEAGDLTLLVEDGGGKAWSALCLVRRKDLAAAAPAVRSETKADGRGLPPASPAGEPAGRPAPTQAAVLAERVAGTAEGLNQALEAWARKQARDAKDRAAEGRLAGRDLERLGDQVSRWFKKL